LAEAIPAIIIVRPQIPANTVTQACVHTPLATVHGFEAARSSSVTKALARLRSI